MPRTSAAERKLAASTDAYLRNCADIGLSERSVRAYTFTIQGFMDFFIESGENLRDPDYATILMYRDDLVGRGCKPSTVSQHLTRLHAFFLRRLG